MSIDPSIPLRAQAPPPLDLFGSLGQIIQLRGLQQREESERRKLEKERQYEALAQQYGDDPEAFTRALSKVDPLGAQEFAKTYQQSRKEQFSAYEKQLDSEARELETATRTLQAIPDGDIGGYAAWRAQWTSRNPDLNKVLPPPEQLTPERKAELLTLGQSTTDFLKAKQEGVKAFLTGDYRKGLGNTLAVAPSLEIVQQTLAEAKKAIPKAAQGDVALFEGLLASAGGDLATFRALAAEASMTAKERADITSRTVDDDRQAERDAETRRHNRVIEARTPADPLVAIVGKDGKPVLVPRSQAVGQTPAAGAGGSGGGRGVTSGDANRLADFDTSLDDVRVLRETITGIQSTGTKAAIGAALPNWVSEATGRGISAKQKQAVIDRVKQVIGKALEGGVLRKEDEYKYKKILPVISDTPEVAKAKLDGLEAALVQRRERQLEALEDAGYDTTRYRARTPASAATPPPPGVERWERGPDGKMRKVKG